MVETEAFYEDPKFWVMIAFFAFFILFGKKIGTALGKALDARAARIAEELNEARRLREEAEALLASYHEKRQEAQAEAEALLVKSREEAAAVAAQAEKEMQAQLAARIALTEAKIALAEKQAFDEAKRRIAELAVAAARTRLEKGVPPATQSALIESAIADIGRKLH